MESSKKKVEKERAGERKREGGSRIKWKVEKEKGEVGDIWVYLCGGEKSREKKKKKRMDDGKKERKNNIKKKK